jgi:hypothetical protein
MVWLKDIAASVPTRGMRSKELSQSATSWPVFGLTCDERKPPENFLDAQYKDLAK